MRWLLALLLLTPVGASLLEDGAGDVAVDHCGMAQTPITGFEAMDLLSLEITETPRHLTFKVDTTGLEREANYDAGNYFIHVRHGDANYAIRIYQDNAGTGAVAEVLLTEGVAVFGRVWETVPASVQGSSIVAEIPKNTFRADSGTWPGTGRALEDIFVSAEAHATGVYFCDDSGPAIVHDRMPDAGGDLAVYPTNYGGQTVEGPMELLVPFPFRASNGEATTYGFETRITNLADSPRTFHVNASLPTGWTAHLPPPVTVDANDEARVTSYIDVPFLHVHGTTLEGTLTVTTDGASVTEEIGVHYLTVPQPSGHHPRIHLHSLPALGFQQLNAAAGQGDHILYWNTIEEDPSDQAVPITGRTEGDRYAWFGCLTPDLELGMHADSNATGQFTLHLGADIPISGTLEGHIGIVPDGPRSAICQDAGDWMREEILALEAMAVSVNGVTQVEGAVFPLVVEPRRYMPGTDLLLSLYFTPDRPLVSGAVTLQPGGVMDLPLFDFHEPAVVPADRVDEDAAAPTDAKESPAPLPLVVLGAAFLLRRLK